MSKISPIGFVVIEACEQYEQILALEIGDSLPDGGVLTWAEGSVRRAVFPTREAARAAIKRTEHYRLAFGYTNMPEAKHCKVEIIAAVEVAQ